MQSRYQSSASNEGRRSTMTKSFTLKDDDSEDDELDTLSQSINQSYLPQRHPGPPYDMIYDMNDPPPSANRSKRQYSNISGGVGSDVGSAISSRHGYDFVDPMDDVTKWRRQAIPDQWIPKHCQSSQWRKRQFGTALWAAARDPLALNFYLMNNFGFWHPFSWWNDKSIFQADFLTWIKSSTSSSFPILAAASSTSTPSSSDELLDTPTTTAFLKASFVDTCTLTETDLFLASSPFYLLWRQVSGCIVDDRYGQNMTIYTSWTVDDHVWIRDLSKLKNESRYFRFQLFSSWLNSIYATSPRSEHRVGMTLLCFVLMLHYGRILFADTDPSSSTPRHAWNLFKMIAKLALVEEPGPTTSSETEIPRFIDDIFGRPSNNVMLLILCWQACRLMCRLEPNASLNKKSAADSLLNHVLAVTAAATTTTSHGPVVVKKEPIQIKTKTGSSTLVYTLRPTEQVTADDHAIHMASDVFHGAQGHGNFRSKMVVWMESMLNKLYLHLRQINPSFVVPVLATSMTLDGNANNNNTTADRSDRYYKSIVALSEQFLHVIHETEHFD